MTHPDDRDRPGHRSSSGKAELPEARIARGPRRHDPALRGLAMAIAVGAVAAGAVRWHLAAAIAGAAAIVVVGLVWLWRHLGAVDETNPLVGDREFALRPRAALVCFLLASTTVASGMCLLGQWVAAAYAGAFALFVITFVVEWALFVPRILVTDTHVTLPRARWTRDEISIPLDEVSATLDREHRWGTVEISSARHGERTYSRALLGKAAAGELVAIIEYRAANARAAAAAAAPVSAGRA